MPSRFKRAVPQQEDAESCWAAVTNDCVLSPVLLVTTKHNFTVFCLKIKTKSSAGVPTTVLGKVHPRTGHEGAKWKWVINATSRSLYPQGKTRYPLYRRLGGPQGRSGRVWKIVPPSAIRSPGLYTECAIATQTDYFVWVLILVAHTEERRLRVFENGVLRGMFGRDNRGVEKST